MSTTFAHRLTSASGTTLSSQIVMEIQQAVFENRLKPGDFLGGELELSKQFGVSRITVRDALRTLSATGIVEIRQGAGGGARIAQGNLEHFGDALAIQLHLAGVAVDETLRAQSAIEGMAAELAAIHRTQSDLDNMAAAIERAEESSGNPAAFTEASLGFHLSVAEASRNRALFALLRALRYVVWPAENKSATPEVVARVQRTHRTIYQRIKAGDGPGARQAMTRHLGGIRASKQRQKEQAAVFC